MNKFFAQAASFLLVGAIIYAFFSVPSHQTSTGFLAFFEGKMKTVEVWVDGWSNKELTIDDLFNGVAAGTPGAGDSKPSPEKPKPGEPKPSSEPKPEGALDAELGVVIGEPQKVSYNRKEWKHWASGAGANGQSCWDVREEVLYRQAVKGSLVLEDKNKGGKITTDYKKACKIVSGKWKDPFSGKTFTNPSDLDIDHVIPLSYAAKQGGQAWSEGKKAQYANDLNGSHLLAVKASENRSKGDKGPSQWKPSDKSNHCAYSKNWIAITKNYNLTVPKADAQALKEMLKTC